MKLQRILALLITVQMFGLSVQASYEDPTLESDVAEIEAETAMVEEWNQSAELKNQSKYLNTAKLRAQKEASKAKVKEERTKIRIGQLQKEAAIAQIRTVETEKNIQLSLEQQAKAQAAQDLAQSKTDRAIQIRDEAMKRKQVVEEKISEIKSKTNETSKQTLALQAETARIEKSLRDLKEKYKRAQSEMVRRQNLSFNEHAQMKSRLEGFRKDMLKLAAQINQLDSQLYIGKKVGVNSLQMVSSEPVALVASNSSSSEFVAGWSKTQSKCEMKTRPDEKAYALKEIDKGEKFYVQKHNNNWVTVRSSFGVSYVPMSCFQKQNS